MIQTEAYPAATLRSFEVFMARMSGSGRSAIERHLLACEKDTDFAHVLLWKRLVGLLGGLTPQAAPVPNARAVRFYVPDGKYKLQIFALEDLRDGVLSVYCCDAREAALLEGVIVRASEESDNLYRVGGARHEDQPPLLIELLNAAGTTSAPDYYKHMLGWNRSAIRMSLAKNSTAAQIQTVEAMCHIALALPASKGAAATVPLRPDYGRA
jgi:hypothetical protein